jgi:ATP-binding cassette subfamily F protein uup
MLNLKESLDMREFFNFKITNLMAKPQSVLFKGVDLNLNFGSQVILGGVTVEVRQGEIIGIVGRNGCGKSSLLKLIAGELIVDSGKIEYKNRTTVSYLAQDVDSKVIFEYKHNEIKPEFDLSKLLPADFELEPESHTDTIWQSVARSWLEFQLNTQSEEILLILDILHQSRPWTRLNKDKHPLIFEQIQTTLQRLGIWDFDKNIGSLSGGERRKLGLAQALVGSPDLLILDEPTNHLDIPVMENLEKLLNSFEGAVILVSHDRFFLDKIANRMIEIWDGKIFDHLGNYQSYLESKAVRLEIAETEEGRRQAFLKRELQWVRAGVKARGTKDKGRMQRFQSLKEQRNFAAEDKPEMLLPPIRPLSNKILNFENVNLSIGDKKVLTDFNFSFQPRIRLGLVGPNGSGKTTIIKAILEEIQITSGRIVIGHNTDFNYQDQSRLSLNPENTPFEEIGLSQENTKFGDTTINTRKYLKRMLFDSRRIMTPIKNFSGGEKARLLLAKILKSGGNFLILDEPTNDLDLETIRLLEESLNNFAGVAIVVSHDRYFLNRTCNYILSLEGNGKFRLNMGNWDDLMASNDLTDFGGLDFQEKLKTPKESKIELKTKQKELLNLEKQITDLETQIKKVGADFANPDYYNRDKDKMARKLVRLETLETELNQLMARWEELQN